MSLADIPGSVTPDLRPHALRGSRRKASRRPRRDGFTLIELMLVVVLVGISAAMIAPAIQRTMAINRASRCQYDFARLLRRARGEAIGTGRAHLIDINSIATDVHMNVYLGDSSSCQRSSWLGIVGVSAPVDGVAQSTYDAGGDGVFVRVTMAGGPAPRQICYEPDGERFDRSAAAGVFQRTQAIITVTLDRHEQGVGGIDVLRQIVIPQFGVPRVVR